MKPLGIIYGVVAGVAGAAVWFAIAYYANVEVGYVAWGIGALIGFAVAMGNGTGGPVAGVGAAIITIASLLAGKFAIVEVQLQEAFGSFDATMTDADMVAYMAEDVVDRHEAAGKPLKWPEGVDPDEAWEQHEYPPNIWKEAEADWNKLTADEQQEYHKSKQDEFDEQMGAITNELRKAGFLGTFGLFDILFFGLGIATAFGIANNADEA